MPTALYQQGLQIFAEANELSGANNSAVSSLTDLSGYNRHLVAASNQPLIKAPAVNGKKSVVWDGTKNPLVYTGALTIRCGFLVVKITESFNAYRGILTSPADAGILVGNDASSDFFDFSYPWYEYRLNDRIYSPVTAYAAGGSFTRVHQMPAPIGAFGIIFFRFWTSLSVEGIQLGRDRLDDTRRGKFELALMALYNRDFTEQEIRSSFQSLAHSYQVGIADVFPFQGSHGDAKRLNKKIFSDGQDEPNVRVKRSKRKFFDLRATIRGQRETERFEAFWDAFYPGGRFLIRDYDYLPPVDTIVRIQEPSEPEITGNNPNSLNYNIVVAESTKAVNYAIPATAPAISSETNVIIDTTSPTAPFLYEILGELITEDAVSVQWDPSTDNAAVTGYQAQRAKNAGFSVDVQTFPVGSGANVYDHIGLTPATEYFFRVRAFDAAGNYSAWSNVESATTDTVADEIAPSVPTNLAAGTQGVTSMPLTWTASTDNVAVTGYRVQYATNAGFTTGVGTQTFAAGATGGAITGLQPNTLYYFRIQAYDAVPNTSAYSAAISATTAPDTTAPTITSFNLTAPSSAQINLSWTATDNVAVTGFDLQFSTGGGAWTTLLANVNQTSFNHTGLSPSTTYDYRIRARDGAGNASAYSTDSETTLPSGSTSKAVKKIRVYGDLYLGGYYNGNPQFYGSNSAPLVLDTLLGSISGSINNSWHELALPSNATEFKYLTVTGNNGGYFVVNEVEFLDENDDPLPVIATYGSNNSNAASLAFDGDTSTQTSSNAGGMSVGVEIDLT